MCYGDDFLDVCKFKGILLIKQGRIRYFLGGHSIK